MREEDIEEEEIVEDSSEVGVEEEEEYEGEFKASELESFIRITDLWINALKGNVKLEDLKSEFTKFRTVPSRRRKRR